MPSNICLFRTLNGLNTFNMIAALLLIVLGGVALGVGCTAKPTYKSPMSAVLISAGILLAIICVIGVYGIAMESRISILIFSSSLIVLSVTLAVSTTLSYIFREQLWLNLRDEMYRMLEYYDIEPRDKACWDTLQVRNKCCGVDGYEDWIKHRGNVPLSCCYSIILNHPETRYICMQNVSETSGIPVELTGDGCFEIFSASFRLNSEELMIAGMILWAVSIFTAVVGFILARKLHVEEEVRSQTSDDY
ncbi:CD63 antigen-like [Onthophagus taurus]|uniref:CD63 antigen-like n=1 Tax=Onthophagus taurus TaxID=166361 RepID=UPI0039BE4449